MRESRNPFRLRVSESIDTDAAFLNLFEPGILEILAETWCEKVRPIRSAAGGGKTSLLRLFTPSVLHCLHARQKEEHLKELHKKLKELGALDDAGPRLLGVMLLCGRNYAILQDLELDEARKERMFYSLLNVRIVLAVLRAVMAFRQLQFPEDLSRFQIALPADAEVPPGVRLPCTGTELFDWADRLESTICQTLDSFGPLDNVSLPGHDSLSALQLVRPEAITVDGTAVADKTLLMLDDIHKLTASQRQCLVETVIELRSPVGIWIAERFEAMSTEEMLASGAAQGRDYEKPIVIEAYWRSRYKRFESHAVRIADRRVDAATATEVESFRPCLQDSLNGPQWEERFLHSATTIVGRVEELAKGSDKFQEWLETTKNRSGTPRELAVAWKSLELLIERERRQRQKTLFDEPIPAEEMEQKADSSIRQAADLFLAREFGFPYYFGTDRVCRLASLNIQQFLGLAGDVFEEALSAPLANEPSELSPERQHALMKRAAQSAWDEIPNRVRNGRELRNLLEGIGKFAQWYTYRPTAPNDPGVGGTAIRMSERTLLLDQEYLRSHPGHQRLSDAIASALAHNLLVADLDYSCKGDRWMVLNLNRLLCVHFDLPLGYGLYKERPLKTLVGWLDRPFAPPRNEESLI